MWQYVLHRIFGIGEPPNSASFGAGVVGHTAYAVIALGVAAVGIAWAMSQAPIYGLGIVAIIAIVAIIFLLGTWKFADKHPDLAAMGGANWRRFRELQMGTKDQPNLVPLPPESDPLRPLPSTINQAQLAAPDESEAES